MDNILMTSQEQVQYKGYWIVEEGAGQYQIYDVKTGTSQSSGVFTSIFQAKLFIENSLIVTSQYRFQPLHVNN